MDFDEQEFPDFPSPLPEWAVGTTNGELVLGAQLPTRDGRRCGNARIVCLHGDGFDVLTDAGTLMRLNKEEVADLFYPPKWVVLV